MTLDPGAIAALVQLGVAGVVLYLFVTDRLRTKAATDEAAKVADARLAEMAALYEARIKAGDAVAADLRADRDNWRALALGTERRLDKALPAVAAAIGAPVPSTVPTPNEAGG